MLTNAHVAESVGDLVIARMSVSRELVILDLEDLRPDVDLAVYRIRMDTQPWLPLRAAGPARSEPVAVLGHPGGRPLEVSFGRVLTPEAEVSRTSAAQVPLLASIADCPSPVDGLSIRVEEHACSEPWHLLSLRLEGEEHCLDRVESVTWQLHPTFEDPDVHSTDAEDGCVTWLRAWGMFPVDATIRLDGREATVTGQVAWDAR